MTMSRIPSSCLPRPSRPAIVRQLLNYLDSIATESIVKHMLNESRLDHAFQALADPTRRAMLARLSRGPASVSELAKPLPMSLPAVLQHLKALEESGLVRTQKKGRVRTAELQGNTLGQAERWLTDRRTEWEAQADRLVNFLSQLQETGE